MIDKEKVKVGERLYAVNVYRKRGYDVEVVKIGRKYFYVDIHKEEVPFDINTCRQKSTGVGYGYDWELFDSEDEYKNIIEFDEKWKECVRKIDSLSHLSKQKIIEIYEAEKQVVR